MSKQWDWRHVDEMVWEHCEGCKGNELVYALERVVEDFEHEDEEFAQAVRDRAVQALDDYVDMQLQRRGWQ